MRPARDPHHEGGEPPRAGNAHRARTASLLVLLGAGLLAGPAAGEVAVTALQGDVEQLDRKLGLHAAVVEGQPLAVAGGGRVTLLLADQTLVRVCGRAEASITAAGGSRPGEIELREGELEIVALPESQQQAFRVQTPATSLLLLGSGTQVRVAPGGETTIRALASPVQLSQRDGKGPWRLAKGYQLSLEPGEAPGTPGASPHESLTVGSACRVSRGADFDDALRTDRAILVSGLPVVGADAVDAVPTPPVDDLLDIMRADFPAEGLPLQPPSAPSALVTELSKRGMDEEVCDPITCNPVYQLDPPGPCGVPPERGCIP